MMKQIRMEILILFNVLFKIQAITDIFTLYERL